MYMQVDFIVTCIYIHVHTCTYIYLHIKLLMDYSIAESSSIKPVLKRGTSRTDLKRQLSKQSSKLDDILKDAKKPNETSNLIAVERVETGNVCTLYILFI